MGPAAAIGPTIESVTAIVSVSSNLSPSRGDFHDTVLGELAPLLGLVETSSKHVLKFKHASSLNSGDTVDATFCGAHDGQHLGRQFAENRDDPDYFSDTALGCDGTPVR